MYHTVNEFLQDWVTESEATIKLFNNLTDASLTAQVPNYKRTIGRLAWHITGAMGEMMRSAGSPIDAAEDRMEQPVFAKTIVSEYKKASDNLIEKIQDEWTDESLNDEVNMYGEMWKKSFVLKVIIAHQIHHRAQLSVLMRIAGLYVPGIYGPSYEEWAQFGMEPQL